MRRMVYVFCGLTVRIRHRRVDHRCLEDDLLIRLIEQHHT